jgi:hypothetical protein
LADRYQSTSAAAGRILMIPFQPDRLL